MMNSTAMAPSIENSMLRPRRTAIFGDASKAAEARAAQRIAHKALGLMGEADFPDDADNWAELARQLKLRLPAWDRPVTPGAMRKWLGKVGMTVTYYLEWDGSKTLVEFKKRNPQWPLRAWAGLVLEELG